MKHCVNLPNGGKPSPKAASTNNHLKHTNRLSLFATGQNTKIALKRRANSLSLQHVNFILRMVRGNLKSSIIFFQELLWNQHNSNLKLNHKPSLKHNSNKNRIGNALAWIFLKPSSWQSSYIGPRTIGRSSTIPMKSFKHNKQGN